MHVCACCLRVLGSDTGNMCFSSCVQVGQICHWTFKEPKGPCCSDVILGQLGRKQKLSLGPEVGGLHGIEPVWWVTSHGIGSYRHLYTQDYCTSFLPRIPKDREWKWPTGLAAETVLSGSSRLLGLGH